MKTRMLKWSVFAMAAMAAALVGSNQAEAKGPTLEVSLGRRLVRPAVVAPAVMPIGGPVFGAPVYVTPAPVIVSDPIMRIGHPAYPYMVGFPRSRVVVRRTTVIGGTVIGGAVVAEKIVLLPVHPPGPVGLPLMIFAGDDRIEDVARGDDDLWLRRTVEKTPQTKPVPFRRPEMLIDQGRLPAPRQQP